MAAGSDYAWDELVSYLSNPIFQLPVLSFIEEHCLIFEPSTDDSPMYREVHKTYKKIIETLIASFCKDTGMSDEVILKAMRDGKIRSKSRDIRDLTELIVASEDYAIFVRIMIQKNLELQQQALMMIAQVMGGSLPESLVQDSQQSKSRSGGFGPQMPDDDEVLMAVIEQSKKEYEREQKRAKKEDKDLHIIIAMSKVENARIEQTRKNEQDKLSEAMQESLRITEQTGGSMRTSQRDTRPPPTKPPASIPPPASYQPKRSQATSGPKPLIAQHDVGAKSSSMSSTDAAAAWLKSAETEVDSSESHQRAVQKAAASMTGMSDEEFKKRSEFLRQQRDKLIEMKKKEREKQFLSVEKSQPERPASARAARAALKQNIGEGGESPKAEDEKKLAMRRAIADRLKAELINKK